MDVARKDARSTEARRRAGRRRGVVAGLAFALTPGFLAFAATTLAPGAAYADGKDAAGRKAVLAARADGLAKAAATIQTLGKQPAPAELAAGEKKAYEGQSKWLADVAGRCDKLATEMKALLAKMKAKGSPDSFVSEMAQMNMQFLALQNAVHTESNGFQTLSNASAKARTDTAKNSIRNIN